MYLRNVSTYLGSVNPKWQYGVFSKGISGSSGKLHARSWQCGWKWYPDTYVTVCHIREEGSADSSESTVSASAAAWCRTFHWPHILSPPEVNVARAPQFTDIAKSNNLLYNDITFIDCFHKSVTVRKWKDDLIWRLCEYLNIKKVKGRKAGFVQHCSSLYSRLCSCP
jgi:hypothetical protein